MATDPVLDAIMSDLAAGMPEAADVVTFRAGGETCSALFDDGELVATDTLGQFAQEIQTVVRYRDGNITRPVADATVTVVFRSEKDRVDADYLVREVRRDPDNPGMIRVVLAPT